MVLNAQLQQLKQYASKYDFPPDMFIKSILGANSPEEAALENLIKDTLVDQVDDLFHLSLDQQHLQEELVKSLPKELIDEAGRVNMTLYRQHLREMSLTPGDYEKQKAAEFRRGIMREFVGVSHYSPRYVATYQEAEDNAEKSFFITQLDFDTVLKSVFTRKCFGRKH